MIHFYRILSNSPNILKIVILLKESGLDYREIMIDPHSHKDEKRELFAVSPMGTVPAIHDDENGVDLFESAAILYYLAEKSGKFLPKDLTRRAEAMKWLIIEAGSVSVLIGTIRHLMLDTFGEMSDSALQRNQQYLKEYCVLMDQRLAGREYLADEYSIADMALYPWVVTFEDMADISLNDYPHLQVWSERMREHVNNIL
ncbi:MAG: glutathione S-transferase family protein [Gammaproteobacteria bacterium]|nr:glutathione S-transferase family protein [Gammaproteobacteria bacterium]